VTSRVSNGQAASEAARSYLVEHHPKHALLALAVLRLEKGWLVQTVAERPAVPSAGPIAGDRPTGDRPGLPAESIVLMVNRFGFVEEVGARTVSRQSAQRCLAGARALAQ